VWALSRLLPQGSIAAMAQSKVAVETDTEVLREWAAAIR